MLLGTNRDDDHGGPTQDEQDADHSGSAGTEASALPRRKGCVPGLWPHHDHTQPGYTPPLLIPQCRGSFPCLPQGLLVA